MAEQPIEKAMPSAGIGGSTAANDDVFKNSDVIATIKYMQGNESKSAGASDAQKEIYRNRNDYAAKTLSDRFGITTTRSADGTLLLPDGSSLYGKLSGGGTGSGNSGGVSGAVSGNGSTGAANGVVGGNATAPAASVRNVGYYGANGGRFDSSGRYVITDREGQNLLGDAKSESQSWYGMSPEEKAASHTRNDERMRRLSEITGRPISYNDTEGVYYYGDNGSRVYDSAFGAEESPYPVWNDRSGEIKNLYDTSLASRITADEESRLLQELLLRANVDKMEKEYDAMARRSAADTAKQLENEKLRQALGGNRGGVGERQFGIYESAGSERLYNIELERQKLRTDTEVQIAQLKAEGKIAEAELIAEFALKKDEALSAEASRVYGSLTAKAEYDAGREDADFNKYMTLSQFAEDKGNNEFNRNVTLRDMELEWQKYSDSKAQADFDKTFSVMQYMSSERDKVFANALSLIPYDNGAMLEKVLGIKIQSPKVMEYISMAFNAAVAEGQTTKNFSKLKELMSGVSDTLINGGKPVITDEGKFSGFFSLPNGSMFNLGAFTDFYSQSGGENSYGGNSGGNSGGDTSSEQGNGNGEEYPKDNNPGADTQTNGAYVSKNSDGKPVTSVLDIMNGINTLNGKAGRYKLEDSKQLDEYLASNNALISSLNATYDLGIKFDFDRKKYVYPNGLAVEDTVYSAPTGGGSGGGEREVPNPWKDSHENDISQRYGSYFDSGYNSGYKLGAEADSSNVAANVPDYATYLTDEVGNRVTTGGIDDGYISRNPGTFAIDNGNGTYSYIRLKKPDFTLERSSTRGGGYEYKKIGLDGKYLGSPSAQDLKTWFIWDSSVANPDDYKTGSYKREEALRAIYPNYGMADDDETGSQKQTNGGGSYRSKADEPGDEGGKKENQWLLTALQSAKTFNEWLATEGRAFKGDSSAIQKGIYKNYVTRKAKEAGLSGTEIAEFFNKISDKSN